MNPIIRYTVALAFFMMSSVVCAQKIGDLKVLLSSGDRIEFKNLLATKSLLIFFDDKCPFIKSYDGRIKELISLASKNGMKPILVYTNGKKPAEVKRFVNSAGWAGEIVMDSEHELAQLLGATKLPEIFLLSQSGNAPRVVYQGAIDDNPQNSASVKNSYAKNAIVSLAQDRAIKQKRTPAMGCRIKRF